MLKEWDLDDATKRKGIDTVTCTVTATDKNGRADSLSTTTTVSYMNTFHQMHSYVM